MTTPDRQNTELHARLARALGAGYELGDRLGYGGFAEVYSAVDTQLKRDIAVKVLKPELAGDVVRERFRREAEAVARVRHPHIVPIYAVGEGEGLAWYVMPRLTGGSLRARLDRDGRLPAPEVRRVLLESASALAVAHRAGLVHRDIKPDNIMLDGDDAHVLLMDFGIAKALGLDAEGLTGTGIAIGTPQYMSPEQASGEAVDQRSDIYSLGVVGYQMLTGQLPFEAGTVAAMLVKQIVEEAPSVLRKRPDCPSDLAAAVTRCLAKAPADRWATADDLVRALEPAPVRSSGRGSRESGARGAAPDPLRRFRLLLTACSAGVAVALVADIVRGQVLLGPLTFLVAAFVVAAHYGRLWTAGYAWRDVFGSTGRGGATFSTPLDSAEFGPHREAIRQARGDRAALRARVERVPRAERAPLEPAIPVSDELVAQAAEIARQLYGLERQIEPGVAEIERRVEATRAENASPGRAQRLAVLERRREAVRGLVARRAAVAEQLAGHLATLGKLRAAVERAEESGVAGARDAVSAVLRDADACLRGAPPPPPSGT
jgi:tRNA A-37 threonylcarbamoyl transferase component Bud32